MQIVNPIMSYKFSKHQRWKEYPRENNTRATKFWETVPITSLGGEFWACDEIAEAESILIFVSSRRSVQGV